MKKYITTKKISNKTILEFAKKADETSGAYIIFSGKVRADEVNGNKVKEIFYDCYIDMAESECKKIENEVKEKFNIKDVLIKHRIGKVKVGETALLVGVISSHRKEGFQAIQYIIDNVKMRVSIWKKEIFKDGKHRWKEND